MRKTDYLRILVDEIHSTIVATIGDDGHPVTRAIDMMLWDEKGVYFLTAKGKAFYDQLMEQKFIALSAVRDGKAVSLRGKTQSIGSEKLDEIFEKNTYMQKIYPPEARTAIEVFRLHEADGEYFDISDPEHVFRDKIQIGSVLNEEKQSGYFITEACIGCGSCLELCPQKCIDLSQAPAVIDQNHCLHCGNCLTACPVGAVERR